MALVPFPQKNALQKREPDWDDSDESLDDSGKMSFLEHLDELRKRIIWSLVGVAVGAIIACFFVTDLYSFVMDPMQQLLRPGEKLVYTEPTEAFALYLKLAVIAGLMIASPIVNSTTTVTMSYHDSPSGPVHAIAGNRLSGI